MDKCKKCFWYDVSLEKWPDFKCKRGIDKEKRINEIKERKCKECKEGFDNFSEKWVCKKCEALLDGHNYFFHGSLCDSCWQNEVNGGGD